MSVPRRTPQFIGEIVEKRHPALIAVVFIFGLFLASVPFLFSIERSPYTEALTLYDNLCVAVETGDVNAFRSGLIRRSRSLNQLDSALLMSRIECVDRQKSEITFDPAPGREYGLDRAYDLVITPPGAGDPVRMRFAMEEEILLWSP